MKILITGGAGFVGSSIAVKLKTKYPNYQIVVFDNLRRRGSELNLKEFKKYDIEFIHGDIRNMDDLNTLSFDLLIEASAEASVLAGMDGDRKYLIDTNLGGLINSLEISLKNRAKIIFLSTSRVYPVDLINSLDYKESDTRYEMGQNDTEGVTKEGFSENLPLKGYRTLYGATKLSSELIINEYVNMFSLDAVINRCGVIAGAGQFGKADQGIVAFWVASYFFDKPLTIFGNGKQVRDILNINDLFDLIDLQIHNFTLFNKETFNVGGGLNSSLSLIELDRFCKKVIKDKSVLFKENRELDIKYYITDNGKISKSGWKPKRDIKDTIMETLEWIEDNQEELKWIFV